MNEGFVTDTIRNLPISAGTAFDIGANHGLYTAQLADKFRRVYTHSNRIRTIWWCCRSVSRC